MKKFCVILIVFLMLVSVPVSSLSLNDLTDVIIANPTDGSVLMFNSTLGNWTNDNVSVDFVIPSWLYAFHAHNQDCNTSANPFTCVTLNTGQGNYELYYMNQNVGSSNDVSFTQVDVFDTDGSSTIQVEADENDVCEFSWLLEDEERWSYYVDDTYPDDFYLRYQNGAGSFIGLQSNLAPFFPSTYKIQWGMCGASPNYGVTVPNSVESYGSVMAYAHPTYSDNRSKYFLGSLPKNKCFELYDYLNIQYYYNINSSYDGEGSLIFDSGFDDRSFSVGVDAQDLYFWLCKNFSYKIAISLVYVPNNEDIQYWGVNYDAVNLVVIQALRYKLDENIEHTKHMESWLGRFGYNPLEWIGD